MLYLKDNELIHCSSINDIIEHKKKKQWGFTNGKPNGKRKKGEKKKGVLDKAKDLLNKGIDGVEDIANKSAHFLDGKITSRKEKRAFDKFRKNARTIDSRSSSVNDRVKAYKSNYELLGKKGFNKATKYRKERDDLAEKIHGDYGRGGYEWEKSYSEASKKLAKKYGSKNWEPVDIDLHVLKDKMNPKKRFKFNRLK